ncbi:hypothetical protein MYSTI_07650 [Myxococcus stipitatus DSM 14675]|uniref:Uncharacterized protein n=1 Tax=Myxococcus stipitatus (strain DSM 14675 / JCM 12634 / Mx s8) TaxID=1278073 RepID=L7UN06_MYXSD|nr:hypothetical protein [Myxococcus stipitatus]AGC48922.1 hypothetical protein MYSTI_07650 [Myxococcus stipitatus DSM 14675]
MATACTCLLGSGGCATVRTTLDVRVHDTPNGPVRYEGDIVGPYDDMDELVDVACTAMMQARAGSEVSGYCALFFDDETHESKWVISHVSPMREGVEHAGRTCELPGDPAAPASKSVLFLGAALEALNGPGWKWQPTHFLNQDTGETWGADTLVFDVASPGTCTVHGYIGFSRVVTRRVDGGFVPLGAVYNDHGLIQALKREEQSPLSSDR